MAPGPRLQELTAKYMQNPRRFFVPLANEYRKANELDQAIALCREHLPAQPGHMSGHIVLARAYFEKGDVEAAREVFLTSVALDDENLIALRHLGDIARSRQELTEARQWYARVLEADPQNDEIERLLRTLGGAPVTAPAPASESPAVALAEVPRDDTLRPVGDIVVGAVDTLDTLDTQPPVSALELSALADPTPPGLRAILDPDFASKGTTPPAELPPVPGRTLDTLDLRTLDSPESSGFTPVDGIRVDDGVGFMIEELDQLVDPAAGAGHAPTLPPVHEADFSAGIETPTAPANVIPKPADDPLLSRPGFGALASFASWRTAQDRDTPSQPPTQRSTPPEPVPQVAPERDASPADSDLFWSAASADAAPTAPEFVTETMAALYAQQGFTQQALDIYRALLARTPGDDALASRIAALESQVVPDVADKALQEDADRALQFDDPEGTPAGGSERRSPLEDMYEVSPPPAGVAALDTAFGGAWSAEKDRGDDWFADDAAHHAASDAGQTPGGIFGVTTDAFGQPALSAFDAAPETARSAGGAGTAIATVFGPATIAAADAAAADMLIALAGQMVGRLPKDAPTLPVPDVLELPSAVPGDEATGTSPAPLLSFDRFFSGSGSPPRQRIDTPAARTPTPARAGAPSQPPPSLSPTFGGVPVIAPPPASVTPSSWASFDQFVPPAIDPGASPNAAPSSVPSAADTPAPARPLVPPVPMKQGTLPPAAAPYASFTGVPSEFLPPAALQDAGNAAATPRAADESSPAQPPDDSREAPSEFHKWLEGLS